MRIKSIRIKQFRRFANLVIPDLPSAKLVVLAGPNGSGKSSLFDAFSVWRFSRHKGVDWDNRYYKRDASATQIGNEVEIDFFGEPDPRKAIYLRSAYRNDPSFTLQQLVRQGDPTDEIRFRKMIESDSAVALNYARLASDAFEDAFEREEESTTIKQFRDKVIGDLRAATSSLFPDLELNTLGNPLNEGTFRFDKGESKGFSYQNLSGGEKSAFDLMLDIIVKRRSYNDTVFVIDEPEAHMNTKIQGKLLEIIYGLIPDSCQLWISTHSIGMMRKARELYEIDPTNVLFLDFGIHNFDEEIIITPTVPTRTFWESVLTVALDDLAHLVAPKQIVICEGHPISPVGGKNEEHDARCYSKIFANQIPDVSFISAGSSKEVSGDRLKFASIFPKIIKGITVSRLIDRDDHDPSSIKEFKNDGIKVLTLRHLESYLYDMEVISQLYLDQNKYEKFNSAKIEIERLISDSIARGNPSDDVKSAAPNIYSFLKRDLELTGCGNDHRAFSREILAQKICPPMKIYELLKEDIFGL